MKKLLLPLLIVFVFSACKEGSETRSETMGVDSVAAKNAIISILDSMHNAVKSKNIAAMSSFFTEDGMYYGTDPSEVWNKKQLIGEATKSLSDSSSLNYNIERRDVMFDDDKHSAIVVEQFKFPVMSDKFLIRGISRVDKKENAWRIDFYSWNVIPKNEDVPKINKALE